MLLPLVSILSQINPVGYHTLDLFKLYFNIILPYVPEWFLLLKIFDKNCVGVFLFSMRARWAANLLRFVCVGLVF
jgi:hypothetical protein